MEEKRFNAITFVPGDILVSQRTLVSWQGPDFRGEDDDRIKIVEGTLGLLVATFFAGRRVRLLVVVNGRLCWFSHSDYCVPLNWGKTLP